MADRQTLGTEWQEQQRPPMLSRRFEFASYAETRRFLDLLAELSERTGNYPDLNFGRQHVNVNVNSAAAELGEADYRFAGEVDALFAQLQGSTQHGLVFNDTGDHVVAAVGGPGSQHHPA